jgi:hypothetical protein
MITELLLFSSFPAQPTPSFTQADPRGRLNLNSTKEAWGTSAGGTIVRSKQRREDADNSEYPGLSITLFGTHQLFTEFGLFAS